MFYKIAHNIMSIKVNNDVSPLATYTVHDHLVLALSGGDNWGMSKGTLKWYVFTD